MTIRKIKPSDKPQLFNLLYKFYVKHNRQKIFSKELIEFEAYKNIEKVMKNAARQYVHNKKYLTLVAEEDEKLVGYICGNIKSKPHKIFDKEGYIEDWFVEEEYRNKKIGKTLFNALINEFKKMNCSHITTDAYAINKHAIGIYHKMGFIDFVLKMIKKL